MNARDTLSTKENRLQMGGFFCSDLAKKFGTPLYVLDGNYMRDVACAFVQAANDCGKGAVAFASKAFCSIATTKLLQKEGMWFDAVSGGEVYLLHKAGANMSHVLMHGNAKTEQEIACAIGFNVGYIVVDNYDEAAIINRIAAEKGTRQNVLVRCNPCVSAHTYEAVRTAAPTSKFGFNILDGDALGFVKELCSSNYANVCFKGLHMHIGSQIYEADAYTAAVDAITNFMVELKRVGIECDVLDVGGGFGIYYTEADPKFTPARYAYTLKLVFETVREDMSNKGLKEVFLIAEPGRSVVGEAGITLYTCQGTRSAGGENYVFTDGGMFDNPRHALYESQYEATICDKANDAKTETATLVGKCCECGDIITKDIPFQRAERDDVIAVFSTGAYNYSMASHYNLNAVPAVVMVLDGNADYVVKPESYEDLTARDVTPSWLN